MKTYTVTNPATGTVVKEYPAITDAELDAMIERAHEQFLQWRQRPIAERAALLARVADIMERELDTLADIAVTEVGKTPAMARAELGVVLGIFRYYAENAESLLAPEVLPDSSAGRSEVRKEPLGVILGVEPWNYPYYQLSRVIAPNLLLGNAVLIKPAGQCPESALQFDRVLKEAGMPEGLYATALISAEQVATALANPLVQGVTLTGSEAAGAAVAAAAGANLKKCVLELGGSDPLIVLDSADLKSALTAIMLFRVNNAGQTCNSPKRLIVTDGIADAFCGALSAAVSSLVVGDPTDPQTQMGPLSSAQAAAEVDAQVRDAIDKGATVLVPGGRDGDGAYFTPVVITDITPQMRMYSEEVFGPVFMVYRVPDATQAVRLANDTTFGLGAAVFGAEAEAEAVAAGIEAGMVFVNRGGTSAGDLPFGGVKRSGNGRELGRYGVEEFANRKLYAGVA